MMKKRLAALVLALGLLLAGSALAEEPTPMDMLFMRGKEAVGLLAAGEIDRAVELLGFVFDVESEQTEESFRQLVNEGLMLIDTGMVQTEVALCWLDEFGVWNLGIPLVEPVSWDVEALILKTRDMEIFCGYEAANWGMLEEAAVFSTEAYWNTEYAPGAPVLFADE